MNPNPSELCIEDALDGVALDINKILVKKMFSEQHYHPNRILGDAHLWLEIHYVTGRFPIADALKEDLNTTSPPHTEFIDGVWGTLWTHTAHRC